jgi:hypothetical protein
MTSHVIGAQPAATMTTAEAQQSGKSFALGDRYTNFDHKEYVYCQAASAIAANFVCTISETYAAAQVTTASGGYGRLLGVPEVAVASGSLGWFQVKGPALIQVSANAAANTRLNTTATAGQLNTDGTSTNFPAVGMVLTAARGGTPGTALAVLNYPSEGVVL